MDTNNRIKWVDIAKGIGIILVIVGHTIALEYSAPIYTFHMPLFIFLSGFVFHLSQGKHSVRITIVKRVLSLLLPFFCFI
jgi:fucose 4-O-acetylase-like acetyltransferase